MKNEKEIIKLLKTGNFTIAYHDSSYCQLYKGKFDYENLPEDGGDYDFEGEYDGYIPEIVYVLVKALNGKVETI